MKEFQSGFDNKVLQIARSANGIRISIAEEPVFQTDDPRGFCARLAQVGAQAKLERLGKISNALGMSEHEGVSFSNGLIVCFGWMMNPGDVEPFIRNVFGVTGDAAGIAILNNL